MADEDARNLAAATEYVRSNPALLSALGVEEPAEVELHPLGMGEHNLNYWFCGSAGSSGVGHEDCPETDLAGDSSGSFADSSASAFSTTRKFVLRINVATQPFHRNQVRYEYGALRALEGSGRAPKPLYLDDSARAPGKGALVIGFCEGRELDFDHLRPGDLSCAAQLMADVHSVPVNDDCPLFRPQNPLRTLFGECVERYRVYRASAFEDARITAWVERFLAVAEPLAREAPPKDDCSHIVNTETLPSHFLIPESSAADMAAVEVCVEKGAKGALRCDDPGSFIDWERPIVGEVAQDVAYFTSPTTTFWDSEFLFPASEVESFVESYWRAVDGRFDRGAFDKRFRAWRVMTALRSATWCCRALITYGGKEGVASRSCDGSGIAEGDAAGSTGVRDVVSCRRGSTGAVFPGLSSRNPRVASHTTSKTAAKLPIYLSDEFMELVYRECFC